MALDGIQVQGAREHNLQSVNIFIPRNKITVVTGVSGSGKSSLVFDTVYAEGQRRYLERLSSYSRYFMDKLKPPDVDSIFGLSPVVAIDQKTISLNPRSTIGTVTEVYDYLRLLFAKLGTAYCPIHKTPLQKVSLTEVLNNIFKVKSGSLVRVFAPVVRGQKVSTVIDKYLEKGFVRARINGELKVLDPTIKLSKKTPHYIDILMDQVYVELKFKPRLQQSLLKAEKEAEGFILIECGGQLKMYSTRSSCPECFFSPEEMDPKLFSWNSPKGACSECNGLGYTGGGAEKEKETEKEEEVEEKKPVCTKCRGQRLNDSALSVKIGGKNIAQLGEMNFEEVEEFLKKLKFPEVYREISSKIMSRLLSDIDLLKRVGVSYLSLSRPTRTLSGGEAQRIRLAGQISSVLVGVLYILDEPSIGLHPSDHMDLLKLIQKIKNRENTILMVEHDEETIRSADYIIDIGPKAGRNGGKLVYQGPLDRFLKSKRSLTADYLTHRKKILTPKKRRTGKNKFLEITGARGNNLKNIHLKIPIGCFIGVTGVSGSGKSSLVVDTLYKALLKKIYKSFVQPLPYKSMKGAQHIDKVIIVDQKPIGRNARSIPATYVGVMSLIRDFMSQLPAAKVRGFRSGFFSFNVKGGRCEHCEGAGLLTQEMYFLSSAVTVCEMCQGKRYSMDILNITYRDKNVSDILDMTVKEAVQFFKNHPQIYRHLKSLEDVGLSYLTLGQSSASLSGGEAQRIKLTKELSKKHTGKTLYILDEPTTGLHFDDIQKLLRVLNHLVDKGNTVVVIEHNMDVIKCCDYLVDLGPKGGLKGGLILAEGSPEHVAKSKKSATGFYLKSTLKSS